MSKEIKRRETRFAIHLPKNYNREDTHYVKEHLTYEDGTTESRTILVSDFERPVWVESKQNQNYRDKKEYAPIDRLLRTNSTQSDLDRTVARLLDKAYLANQPQVLRDSPYVYGYDITSTSLIKLISLNRNKFTSSPYTYATFDIETSTSETDRDIYMCTITMSRKGKVYSHTAIWKPYLKNVEGAQKKLSLAIETYLPQYKDKLVFESTIHETEIDMLKAIFKTANDWAPDFLSIWNMDFDIGVIMDKIERKGVNPIDVICDQNLPRDMMYCRYRKGITKKVTASGVVKPINPSLQWHTLNTTSKFYVIDAMCVYRQLRMAQQEEPSYSLDAILTKQLNTQKLRFTAADEYKGVKWHEFMTANYPIEYIVYNIYDCLSMLELEEKLGDVTRSLPDFAGMTDFSKFNSQSAKLRDSLFLFGLDEGLVLGTAPGWKDEDDVDDSLLDDEDEDDDDYEDPSKFKTLGLAGWIQLLPQAYLLHEGSPIFSDHPFLRTAVRKNLSDLDVASSYPSVTLAGNISLQTCNGEVIEIGGVPEHIFRQQNLGVVLGPVNSIEYFETMFELPPIEQITNMILNDY